MKESRWYHDCAFQRRRPAGRGAFLLFVSILFGDFLSQCRRSSDGTGCMVELQRGEAYMLDLTFIRNHPDAVKEAARVKNNPIDIDALLALDQQVLTLQHEVEEARAQQN